jgi:hypothetical protein
MFGRPKVIKHVCAKCKEELSVPPEPDGTCWTCEYVYFAHYITPEDDYWAVVCDMYGRECDNYGYKCGRFQEKKR